MGVVGLEGVVPTSATKPVLKKGGVGFADVEMIYNIDGNADDNQQLVKNNTAVNSSISLQVILASLSKKIIPVWTISQHKPRLSASATIVGKICKRIKPLDDVDDIQIASTKFQ